NPSRLANRTVRPLEYALEVARVPRCGNQRRIAGPCPEGVDLDERAASGCDPVLGVADLAGVDQSLGLPFLKVLPVSGRLAVGTVDRVSAVVIALDSVVLIRRVVRWPHLQSGNRRGPIGEVLIAPNSQRTGSRLREGNAESENNQATAYDVASVGHRLPRYRLYAASRLVNHSQSLKVCRVRLPLELASACFHTNCSEFLTVLSGIGAGQHRDAVRRLRHIRFANA